ncbi:MAG: helix-turn-helix transcriptional regulator [bacterium]
MIYKEWARKKGFLTEKKMLKKLNPVAREVFSAKRGKYSEVFKIAGIIYKTRVNLNLTQAEFAKKCFVSKGFISQIENGRHEGIGINTLDKILDAVGYCFQIKVKKKAA